MPVDFVAVAATVLAVFAGAGLEEAVVVALVVVAGTDLDVVAETGLAAGALLRPFEQT